MFTKLFLYFIMLIFSFLVIFLENPVYSLLSLIFVFICASIFLFTFEYEFMSILLILVYVGAIAVLFLFVVMLLDLKQKNVGRSLGHFISVGFLAVIFFAEICYLLIPCINFDLDIPNDPFYFDWYLIAWSISDLELIGSCLFTRYFHFLLIIGIILLVAMIGAIVLTLNFTHKTRHQSISKQLSRW